MSSKELVQICVPVCERSFSAMKQAAERAARIGHLIELRLDCLDPIALKVATSDVANWLPTLRRPVILTLRPLDQGGQQPLAESLRVEFFSRQRSADFIDLELDLVQALSNIDEHRIDWKRTICSFHDFSGVPDDLELLYERMASTRARVLKIAVQARDVTDCLPVFRLLDRAVKEGRDLIAIAMGAAGIATRILGPSRGAFLTYGASESESATGPGQLTVAELNDLFHIRAIDKETQITGLVGKPVGHSISPRIHNAAFESRGVNATYIPFEVEDVSSFFRRMVHPKTRELNWNLCGLSVTTPHKATVMRLLDWVEPAALEIGAVNTIVVEPEALHGYNTDGEALVQALAERLGALSGLRCAVIGAGGAARAAVWGLRHDGANVTVFARNLNKARLVAETLGADCQALNGSSFHNYDVVINATPLGTRGTTENLTAAVADQLQGARLAYDLVYNPSDTRFMREARKAGCDTLGGLPMLICQAKKQFKLWTGLDASDDVMQTAAEKALRHA